MVKKPRKKIAKIVKLPTTAEALTIIAQEYATDPTRRRFYSVLMLALPHMTSTTMAEIERMLIPTLGLAVLEKHLSGGAP